MDIVHKRAWHKAGGGKRPSRKDGEQSRSTSADPDNIVFFGNDGHPFRLAAQDGVIRLKHPLRSIRSFANYVLARLPTLGKLHVIGGWQVSPHQLLKIRLIQALYSMKDDQLVWLLNDSKTFRWFCDLKSEEFSHDSVSIARLVCLPYEPIAKEFFRIVAVEIVQQRWTSKKELNVDTVSIGEWSGLDQEKCATRCRCETQRDTAPEIFLSYSEKDVRTAEELASLLERNGLRCFLAPKSIELGALWKDEIRSALCRCRLAVIVLTPHSITSKWVLCEASACWVLEKPMALAVFYSDVAGLPGIIGDHQFKMIETASDKRSFAKEIASSLENGELATF